MDRQYSYLEVEPDYDTRFAAFSVEVLAVTPADRLDVTRRLLEALEAADKAWLTFGAALEAYKRGECHYPVALGQQSRAAREALERIRLEMRKGKA